jgi:hypothetical protein
MLFRGKRKERKRTCKLSRPPEYLASLKPLKAKCRMVEKLEEMQRNVS